MPVDSKIDWQAVVNAEAVICSPKTLLNAFRFVKTVAAENGVAVHKVKLPALEQKTKPWLEADEIKHLVSCVAGTHSAFPVLLGLHGLRRSEILAVSWDNIDLRKGLIHVHGAVVTDEHHQYVEKKTNKNATSTRTVPIMIPELRQALEAVPESDRVGKVVSCSPHYIGKAVNLACRRAGLAEVGTHGLRHSFASLAYHLGLSELETMRLGGWADAQTMRRIYTHLSANDEQKAANKMAEFFNNACSCACD